MLKIVDVCQAEGPVELVFRACRRIRSSKGPDSFDLEHGVHTSGVVSLFHLDIKGQHESVGGRYQPSPAGDCHEILSSLKIRYEDFTFIDLGAGKGRVLLVAAQFPFKRSIGVEFARELVETARRNIAHFGCRAEVVHADAADYRFPCDDLIVYLYNPFGAEVLRPVLISLEQISRTHKVYLLYLNPRNSSCVESFAHELYQLAGAKVYEFNRGTNPVSSPSR